MLWPQITGEKPGSRRKCSFPENRWILWSSFIHMVVNCLVLWEGAGCCSECWKSCICSQGPYLSTRVEVVLGNRKKTDGLAMASQRYRREEETREGSQLGGKEVYEKETTMLRFGGRLSQSPGSGRQQAGLTHSGEGVLLGGQLTLKVLRVEGKISKTSQQQVIGKKFDFFPYIKLT